MSANKNKNTQPELTLRKALWSNGLKGYRINWRKVPGRPDIAYPGKKFAIFINGCFWHRCPICDYPLPKHNADFWKNKFEKNIIRDKKKELELLNLGWNILVVWECEIKSDLNNIISKISEQISVTT